jgi:hypothetical protein
MWRAETSRAGEAKTMTRVSRQSKSRTIVMYLGMTALLGATAVTTDIALGFLTNMQLYLHIQAPARAGIAVAPPTHAGPYALSLNSSGNHQ